MTGLAQTVVSVKSDFRIAYETAMAQPSLPHLLLACDGMRTALRDGRVAPSMATRARVVLRGWTLAVATRLTKQGVAYSEALAVAMGQVEK